MIKKAFCMQVYPDQHAEYQRRHEKLWPEMRQMLKEHGAIKYQIFLNPETSTLFGYLEIEDEARWEQIALTPINQKMVELYGRYYGNKSGLLAGDG